MQDTATISVGAAGRLLGISRGLAYELAARGQLPGAFRLGKKRLLVSRATLTRFLESGGQVSGVGR
jgi:excisionase family DNA binding protein